MPNAWTRSLYRLAHDAGEQLHEALTQRPRAARGYFRALSTLRLLPDGRYKTRVLNSVASRRWPQLELPFQRVTLGRATRIRLRPHPGEFDMRSLVERELDYERPVFEWLETCLGDYDTIVEIGANVGVYSAFFGVHQRSTPSGVRPRVYALEPSQEAFTRLTQNLRANPGNVHALQCAVADRTGVLDFYEPAGHLTNGSLRPEFARVFDATPERRAVLAVDGSTLQHLVGAPGRCLLKIDVEGAESMVLRSLRGFIEAHRPDILVEVLANYVEELRAVEYVYAAGYRFHSIEHGELVAREDFEASDAYRDMLLRAVG